jgi:hypothetical protein
MADPISGSILLVAAVAAATSAAEFTLNYLLTPKPKAQERGQLSGSVQIQDSEYGSMIPLVYGGVQPDGSAHGFRIAGNVVYLSDIRKFQTTTTETQGSGKGARSTQIINDNYEADIGIMFADTECELLALYADADLIYDIRPQLGIPEAFGSYEAEYVGNTPAGGATTITDAAASGGKAVSMGLNASLQFNGVVGNGAAYRLNFFYSAAAAVSVRFDWSGAAGTSTFTTTLNSTGGVYALGYFSAPFALASGALNTIKVTNLSSTTLLLDKLTVSVPGVTGAVNPTPVTPPTINHLAPPSPLDPVYRDNPAANFSIVPAPDTTGMVSATVVGGAFSALRFYPGNEAQLPDPIIDAYWQTQFPVEYGSGLPVAPAYKGRCYLVLERFNLTNYQRVPNFTAVLRSKSIITAQAVLDDLAVRSGALTADYDFSALSSLYVRGMAVTQPASLKQIAAQTLQIRWGFDFAHIGGAVTAVLRGGAASYHVPPDHLGFGAQKAGGDSQSNDAPKLVRTSVKLNDVELPRRIDLTAYDPNAEFMNVTRSWMRDETTSQTPQQATTLMALSPDEVAAVARRLGETAWTEGRYAVEFDLPHQYLVATAATVLELDDGDTTYTVRVSERTGPVPGSLAFKGVFVAGAQYHEPVNLLPPTWTPPAVFFPPTLVGQFAETDYLTAEDAATGKEGYYVGVASYEQAPFRGCAVNVDRGAGYRKECDLTRYACVGVCATTLAATNTGSETIDADIYGTVQPTASFTDADIAAGLGRLMVGSERLQYKTATQLGGYANRWRFSNLVNRAQDQTAMSGHSSSERLLVLDDALKFLPVDASEALVARDHKFVAAGADIATVPATSYTFQADAFLPQPSNLKLTRLDASNGSPLTASWDKGRRGSLGPGGVAEVYRVRVFNGATLIRTHYVETGYSEPLAWQYLFGTSSIASVAEDGTLSTAGDATHTCDFQAGQIIYGDSLVHFTLGTHYPPLQFRLVGATVACGRDTATNEIVAPDHYWQNGDQVVFNSASPLSGAYYVVNATEGRFQIALIPNGTPVSLSGTPASFTMSYPALVPSPAFCSLDAVVASGVLYLRPCSVAFDSSKRIAVAGTPCAIEVASGVIRFYVGDLSKPIFVANVSPVRWPYQAQATVGQLSGEAQDALQARVDHTQARSFTYTRAMQQQDFNTGGGGTIPSALTVEVCEMFDGSPGLASTATG